MKRNRIIYYLLCVSALVLASFYGGPVSYSILFGLILVVPVSLIYLLCVYHFFKLYQVVGRKQITAFEPIPYYFVLQNESHINFCRIGISLYVTFSYIEGLKHNTETPDDKNVSETLPSEYELLPGENIRYDGTLVCRYRGDYNVGIKAITITDFFKLFRITYKVPEPISVKVSPRIIRIGQPKSIPELSMISHLENPRLNTDFDAAVREYVPGDPIKGIHWKLSAREGKLKSRLTYGEQKKGISIFLSTERKSKDITHFIPAENRSLEIALALTDYFSSFLIPVSLLYSQQEPVTLRCFARHEMEAVLSQVSQIKFRDGESCPDSLSSFSEHGAFSDCLLAFIIVFDIDAGLNRVLYSLSAFGVRVIVYYVSSHPDMGKVLDMQNIYVVPVNPEEKLNI